MGVAAGRRRALVIIGLTVLVVGVFLPLCRAPFLEMDDAQYVVENRHVGAGLSVAGLRWAFTSLEAFNWHPLTWISHMIDVQLFGMNPGAHHAVSVLLHLASAILLFAVLERMTGALGPSGLAAAFFAVHPLHVESVAWIAERKDVLSALFWFLTMAAYLAYLRRPAVARYLILNAAFALGLMAKPMLVTLPLVLLLLDCWPLGRLLPGARKAVPGRSRAAGLGILIREKLPLLVSAAAITAVTMLAQTRGGSVIAIAAYPPGVRVANAVDSLITYLEKTVWPSHLAVFYPHPGAGLPAGRITAAAILLLLVTTAAIAAGRRLPFIAVGWFWFLATLLPVIGLVQAGDQARADRYTYLPLIGVFLAIGWGAAALAHRRALRPILLAAAVTVTIALAVQARAQVGAWRDGFTLFQSALAATVDNWAAHNALGGILEAKGELAAAEKHYREVVRIRPRFAEGHNNLGAVLAGRRRFDEAFGHYREAMRLNPAYAEPRFNLGLDLAALGAIDEATAAVEEAVRLRPDYTKAWYQLGLLRERQGRTAEAAACYREVLRLQPGMPAAVRRLSLLGS